MGTTGTVDTKLHEAVRFGTIDDVQDALADGCDPNQIGLYQWSPLHEASHNGDVDVIELLVNAGADPNKADLLSGSSSLHYAAAQGHRHCVVVLLNAGARCSTCDNDGRTCLDMAAENCADLLRKQRDEDLIISCTRKTKAEEASKNLSLPNEQKCQCDESEDGSVYDLDTISIATSNSSSSSRPHSRLWKSDKIIGLKTEKAFGRMQLSFEYNAKKCLLKIRVWRVLDLLLPPANQSMISRIYVKSYLRPGNARRMKRKTEDLAVDSLLNKDDDATAVEFDFRQPLEYEGIDAAAVADKVVDLMVCVTQRYTRRSFVVATWNMPLEAAVRRLRRETFPLKSWPEDSLPENMKVYACEPQLRSTLDLQGISHSNPSLRRVTVTNTPRTASDPHLRTKHSTPIPTISVTMPPEDEDELRNALRQISVTEAASDKSPLSTRSSWSSDVVNVPCEEQLDEIVIATNSNIVTEVEVHMEGTESSSLAETNFAEMTAVQMIWSADEQENAGESADKPSDDGQLSEVKVVGTKHSRKSKRHFPKIKRKSSKEKSASQGEQYEMQTRFKNGKDKLKADAVLDVDSCAESLLWDDYGHADSLAMVPMDFEESEYRQHPLEPALPMATTFHPAHELNDTGNS